MATSVATERARPARRQGRRADVNISGAERWLSLLGGGALALYGLRRGGFGGLALAAAGSGLIARGATQHCPVYDALGVDTAHGRVEPGKVLAHIMPAQTIEVERAVTILRPRAELYAFWRDFTNLPRFMQHLARVDVIDERRSHWVARAPADRLVEWDAEITDEMPDELIAWRSTADSDIGNAGSVRFTDAPGDRGTVVSVDLRYEAPGGKLGALFAKLFGEEPEQQVREDLRRFKQVMEVGELPTTEGQPSGHR